jgi:phosphoglycolate phosphatase
MNMGAPTVVFDLDGTLVDSAPDLVATLNTVFAREGLPPVPYETARNLVGGGARSLIERSLKAEGRKLAVQEVDRLVKEFIAHYAAHIADRSRPFPSLEATLDELGAAGCRFAVCTNKLEWLSLRLLDALGLSKRFAAVCGADTFGLQKPNPEFLRRTVLRAGGDISHAVMVGDSGTDIATARAAGVPVVAVDYGYTEDAVAELGPERVISALSELPSAIFELLRVTSPTAAEQC